MKAFGLALATVCALMISVVGAEEKKEDAKTVKCVVAGKEIKIADAKVVEYKKAKVYVCCNNCKAKAEKDPAKYAVKSNHQLAQTGQYKQVKCPIAGRPSNSSKTVEIAGVKVAFCCGNCQGKASKATGDAQLELAFSDKAFKKGYELAKKEKE